MAEFWVERDTGAARLAQALRLGRGYSTGRPLGTEALSAACDRMLVRFDARVLRIACIVDRDARPGATFGLSTADLQTAVDGCATHVDSLGRRRRVAVSIYEVGVGTVTPEARDRLTAYIAAAGSFLVEVALADVDCGARWSSAIPVFGSGELDLLLRDLDTDGAGRRPDRLTPHARRAWIAIILRRLISPPRAESRPAAPATASVVLVLSVGVALWQAVVGIRSTGAAAARSAMFHPWPATQAEACARAYDIITAKPRDPRGHFVEALALMNVGDWPGAEVELRRALSDPSMLALLAPASVQRIRATLDDIRRDRRDAGRPDRRPVCGEVDPL